MKFKSQLVITVSALIILSCETTPRGLPPKFYSHWQRGPHGVGAMGTPTKGFVDLFTRRGPRGEFDDADEKEFYHAAFGDTSALQRFLNSPRRDQNDSGGEVWVAEMVFLLLAYNDDTLCAVLLKERKKVREAVGVVIEEELFDSEQLAFEKTRKLYKYRKQNRSSAASISH